MPSAAERSENNFIRRGTPEMQQPQTVVAESRCPGKQEPWRKAGPARARRAGSTWWL